MALSTISTKSVGSIYCLARLDEVQEEILYYPRHWRRHWHWRRRGGVTKKFNVKVFYVMGKALSGELSCPCDRSCYITLSLKALLCCEI